VVYTRFEKTKPICRALPGNPKSEAQNPKPWYLTEFYLKKQSQFIRIEYCVMRIAKWNLKKQSQFVPK
jgi:hypothetical protein